MPQVPIFSDTINPSHQQQGYTNVSLNSKMFGGNVIKSAKKLTEKITDLTPDLTSKVEEKLISNENRVQNSNLLNTQNGLNIPTRQQDTGAPLKYSSGEIIEINNKIDNFIQDNLYHEENGLFKQMGKDSEKQALKITRAYDDLKSKILTDSKLDSENRKIITSILDKKTTLLSNDISTYVNNEKEQAKRNEYKNAIDLTFKKAIQKRNDLTSLMGEYQNGLVETTILSHIENDDEQMANQKIAQFKCDFHSKVIDAYIKDNSPNTRVYFEKYKNLLSEKEQKDFENAISYMELSNQAKSFVESINSRNLSNEEAKLELNTIKDKDLKRIAENHYQSFKTQKDYEEAQLLKNKNTLSWNKVLSSINNESNNAFSVIDLTLPKEHILAQEKYITKINTNSYISTDYNKHKELFDLFLSDLHTFKNKDINNYRAELSKPDYQKFEQLQELPVEALEQKQEEYKNILSFVKDMELSAKDECEFLNFAENGIKNFLQTNRQNPTSENINEILKNQKEAFITKKMQEFALG